MFLVLVKPIQSMACITDQPFRLQSGNNHVLMFCNVVCFCLAIITFYANFNVGLTIRIVHYKYTFTPPFEPKREQKLYLSTTRHNHIPYLQLHITPEPYTTSIGKPLHLSTFSYVSARPAKTKSTESKSQHQPTTIQITIVPHELSVSHNELQS